MNNKRIYINGRFLTQNLTGVQRFALEVCVSLISQGYTLVLIAPQKKFLKSGYDYLINNPMVKVYYTGLGKSYLWEQLYLFIFMRIKFRGKVRLLNLCNLAPVLYKFNIFALHDIIFIKYPDSYGLFQRMLMRIFVRLLVWRAISILTVSEFSKKEILSIYGYQYKNKTHVVYNAIASSFYKKNTELLKQKHNDKKIFSVLSTFDKSKNLKIVTEAISHISRQDFLVILLGRNIYRHKDEVERLKIDRRFRIVGDMSDEDYVTNLNDSDFFIIPSLYEGFGIPPLEAQHFGCPVLASGIEVLREVLGTSALFFDPNSAQELAALIEKCCEMSSEQYKDYSLRSINNVKRFSFDSSAIKISNIYMDD